MPRSRSGGRSWRAEDDGEPSGRVSKARRWLESARPEIARVTGQRSDNQSVASPSEQRTIELLLVIVLVFLFIGIVVRRLV